MKLIEIENRAGKLRLNDTVHKESADKLIEELETLYGQSAVAAKMVIGDIVCAADNALERVEVEINSPGGSVFEGQRIYSALRGISARGVEVVTTVSGLAASMGSVILMAGDKRNMTDGSRVMIHEASTIAAGDSRSLRKTADLLEGISAEIATLYAERTGGDEKEIRKLMYAETWMTAAQAKENGFIHNVIKDGKVDNSALNMWNASKVKELEAKIAEQDAQYGETVSALAAAQTQAAELAEKLATMEADAAIANQLLAEANAKAIEAQSAIEAEKVAMQEQFAAKEVEMLASIEAKAAEIAAAHIAAAGHDPLPVPADPTATTPAEIRAQFAGMKAGKDRTAFFKMHKKILSINS
jgi:ATP-dependent Clp protease, protease subunit